jgi:hypothetical protein
MPDITRLPLSLASTRLPPAVAYKALGRQHRNMLQVLQERFVWRPCEACFDLNSITDRACFRSLIAGLPTTHLKLTTANCYGIQ